MDRTLTPTEQTQSGTRHVEPLVSRHVSPLLGIFQATIAGDRASAHGWEKIADELLAEEPERAFVHAVSIAVVVAAPLGDQMDLEYLLLRAQSYTHSVEPRVTNIHMNATFVALVAVLLGDDPYTAARHVLGEDRVAWTTAAHLARCAIDAGLWMCNHQHLISPEYMQRALDIVHIVTR